MKNSTLARFHTPALAAFMAGRPIEPIGYLPNGRPVFPIAGGAEDPDDDGKDADGDKGYPSGTPVAEMSAEQQAAYWRDKAQLHEGRNKDLLKITGGKYGDDLRTEFQTLEQLRDQTRTDSERAVEEARTQASATTRTEMGTHAALIAFEFALGHDPETNDQSTLIETLDLTKVLKEDGTVDTAKVRTIAAQIAPAAKGTGKDADFGAGKRKETSATGVNAGADLWATRNKSKTA